MTHKQTLGPGNSSSFPLAHQHLSLGPITWKTFARPFPPGIAWGHSGHPSPVHHAYAPLFLTSPAPVGMGLGWVTNITCLPTTVSGTKSLFCPRKLDGQGDYLQKEGAGEMHQYSHQFKTPRSEFAPLHPRSLLETPARGGHWSDEDPREAAE